MQQLVQTWKCLRRLRVSKSLQPFVPIWRFGPADVEYVERAFLLGIVSEQSATILVVDDEPVLTFAMRRALESIGFTVVEAHDYDAAVRVFEEQEAVIDLLVADVSLPTKSGIDLARALVRRKPSLKILFTSGYTGASILRYSGMPSLNQFFLLKPFQSAELVSIVERILQSPEMLNFEKR